MKLIVAAALFLTWVMAAVHGVAGLGYFLYQVRGGGVDFADAGLGLSMFVSGISAAILFFLKRKFFLPLAFANFMAYCAVSLYDWSMNNLVAWRIALAWGLLTGSAIVVLLLSALRERSRQD